MSEMEPSATPWDRFASEGDEWLIAYSAIPAALVGPSFFAIGHALELYLKSAILKLGICTNDKQLMKKSHRLKGMWDDLKTADPAFMVDWEVRKSVFESNFWDHENVRAIPSCDDQKHFFQFQSFYYVLKYQPDLKYMRLPWKQAVNKNGFAVCFRECDPNWIRLFRDFRIWLRWGGNRKYQYMTPTMRLPEHASTFIAALFN